MSGSALPAYAVDLERWPLVSARATERVLDDSALDATYRALEAVLARRRSFVALLDLRGGASTSTRRRRLAEWTRRHDMLIRQHMVAMAVVVGSRIERGFVTAAFWLLDNPYDVRVFSDYAEAEAWLLAEYGRRGGGTPDA